MIKREHLTHAIIARENDTVLEVSRILRDTRSRHLLVLDSKDYPVGVISTVDLNNRVLSEEKNPRTIHAKDIMTKTIKVIDTDSTYHNAYTIMSELGTYSIPVVHNNKLLGILEFSMAFKLVSGGAK